MLTLCHMLLLKKVMQDIIGCGESALDYSIEHKQRRAIRRVQQIDPDQRPNAQDKWRHSVVTPPATHTISRNGAHHPGLQLGLVAPVIRGNVVEFIHH
jgi:hypothetical protein